MHTVQIPKHCLLAMADKVTCVNVCIQYQKLLSVKLSIVGRSVVRDLMQNFKQGPKNVTVVCELESSKNTRT